MNTARSVLILVPLFTVGLAQLAAADGSIRVAPEVLVGTPGFEIGVAMEFRSDSWEGITVRPELLLNNDGKIGGGAAILWSLTDTIDLPERQDLAVGPRLIYHNSDDDGFEVSAMGMWSITVGAAPTSPHAIEVLAALGVLQDREHDDADIAASAGAAYAYRF